jgi:hypothetical protein
MKKILLLASLLIIASASLFSDDSFSGKYCAENQAEYDSEKKWIEISRNRYQEIVINSDSDSNAIGYYDIENQEIFYVVQKDAQFNTLMKIRIIDSKTVEVYMLAQDKWVKSSFVFKK